MPVVPVRKHCTVYNLRFTLLHGMEEVIGSIPIRSTKSSQTIYILLKAAELSLPIFRN